MSEWHPIEPPLDQRVLTWDKCGNVQVGRFVDHKIMGRIWEFGNTFSTNVIAWMPLPTPAQRRGDGNG